MSNIDFDSYGRRVDSIPVEINYNILELLSTVLYSSPNKAFEELIANSYDARATKVSIQIPDSIANDSILIVSDNGNSMSSDELKRLWQIGESDKRVNEDKRRLPIGKFGIGKLATYLLAKKLTYICKKNNSIRSVTMNYDKIRKDQGVSKEHIKEIKLNEMEITEKEAKQLINEIKIDKLNFKLFGDDAESSWTVAIMSGITDEGQSIELKSLKWILRTALPIHPNFRLFLNGENIEASKSSGEIIKEWILGKEDEIVKRENYNSREESGEFLVDLPTLKGIKGKVTLYKNSLAKGKSEKWDRSYGIFLMIRGRLINTDNPLLNDMTEQMSYGAFNRIRFEINADDLDDDLTAGRESIKLSKKYKELIKYVNQKLNQAKSFFEDWSKKQSAKQNFSDNIENVSPFYSKVPIVETVKKYLDKRINKPLLINLPDDVSDDDKTKISNELNESIASQKAKLMEYCSLDNDLKSEDPIAKLNLKTKKLDINTHHPFYMAFISELKGKSLLFNLIAANEIFTEASLIEKNVNETIIREIIQRRDELFREFSKQKRPNIFTAVTMLKNSLSDPDGLEDALYWCFACLGFSVEKMGGKGKPDGVAKAILGFWNNKKSKQENKSQNYSFIYEAKSTKKMKIKADTAKIDVMILHKEKHNSDFALQVGIDYEGAEDPKSNINMLLAKKSDVTIVKAEDFLKLMINALPNQLSFLDFKGFLNQPNKVMPNSSKWISKFSKRRVEKKPCKKILEVIWTIMNEDTKEPPTIEAVRQHKDLHRKFSSKDIKAMVKTIKSLAPNLINLETNKVRILTTPDKIMETLEQTLEDQAPQELKEKLKKQLLNN